MSSLIIKIKNAFTFAANSFFLRKINKINSSIKPQTLLIIRLDAIGDYVLFRNYLEVIRRSKKFSGYKITLCGNIIWKDIAETFDTGFVDEFIWMDRNRFKSSAAYRYDFLKQIRQKGFETVIDTAYSREILFGDTIVKASGAKIKIGSEGAPDSHVKWKRALFSNHIYTKLIPAVKSNIFEFNRNKQIIEQLLESPADIESLSIDTGCIDYNVTEKKYVVLFPGAGNEFRRWNTLNFSEIADFLINNYALTVLIGGSSSETGLAQAIIKNSGKDIIDITGKTTLSQFARVLSSAQLLISNDTSAAHIAAAVKTPFICISNGNHILRFHPYPREIFDKAFYIYPEEISSHIGNPEYLEKFRFASDLDINSISVEKVKEAVKKVL